MTERDENNRKLAFWVGPPGYKDILSLEPLDFYNDEAANALLLEKMATIYPDEDIHLEHLKYIGWTILSCHGYKGVTHADRKTAIVNAALALIARQG